VSFTSIVAPSRNVELSQKTTFEQRSTTPKRLILARSAIENVRSIDSLVEELEIRREPLTGEERVRTGAVLERAGYDDNEITALIGEEPDGDESGSEFPMHQLVEFPIETLTELVANGKITESEHTTAIRQKAETGDI
jgi:hypothetical protein